MSQPSESNPSFQPGPGHGAPDFTAVKILAAAHRFAKVTSTDAEALAWPTGRRKA